MPLNSTIAKALIVVQLSLLCFTVLSYEATLEAHSPIPPHHHHILTPAVAPSSHHGHHHHRHAQPPTTTPVAAPSHAPMHSPKPHPKPPVQPPTKSPVKPHPKPPVQPPAKSPVKPHPKPPVQPPTKPPVRPLPPAHPVPRSFVSVQGVVYCKSCKYAGVDTLLGASALSGATVKLQCSNTKYKIEANATTDKNGYFFFEAPKTITSYGAHKCKVGLLKSTNATCTKPSNLHGGITGGVLRPEKAYFVKKVPYMLYTVGPFAFEPECPHH